MGVLSFTYLARIVRGQVISIKGKEYIEAARALGARPWRIMFIDLLPNVMAQIIVYATLLIPAAIVFEASLSFLGVGVPPPTSDWGEMISTSVWLLPVRILVVPVLPLAGAADYHARLQHLR